MNPPKNPDVIVVGSGIAGLTAAAYVARNGYSAHVIEARSSIGGMARTDTRDGFHLNMGPHAFYRGGAGESVMNDLGVSLRGSPPKLGAGKVMFNGELDLFPSGAKSLITTGALSLKAKTELGAMLARLPKLRPEDFAETTVTEWIASSLNTDQARTLLHAILRLSTYGNRPDELAAEVAITQMQRSANSGVLYLDGGWAQILDGLVNVNGVTIETDRKIDSVPDAPAVIVALGTARAAGRLLEKAFEVGNATDVTCTDLGLTSVPPHNFVLGADEPFYFSNFSSVASVAPAGHSLVSVAEYLGANGEPNAEGMARFISIAGVREEDVVMRRSLQRMTTVSSISSAALGGFRGRPTVTDSGSASVFIAGDWVGPEGHLADASFASGRDAAFAAVQHLEHRSRVA